MSDVVVLIGSEGVDCDLAFGFGFLGREYFVVMRVVVG